MHDSMKKLWRPLMILLVGLVVLASRREGQPAAEPVECTPPTSAIRSLEARPETLQLSVRSQGTVAPHEGEVQ